MKNLLKVKSIISLTTTFVFAYLSIKGKIDPQDFMLVLGMVFTYFFNKDHKE